MTKTARAERPLQLSEPNAVSRRSLARGPLGGFRRLGVQLPDRADGLLEELLAERLLHGLRRGAAGERFDLVTVHSATNAPDTSSM